MVVCVGRVVLSLPGNSSLKGKRAVVRRICERTKQRFGVAAAEVDALDVHQRAVLGFACVSNDVRHAQSVIERVLQFASGVTEAVVVEERSEVLRPSMAAPMALPGDDDLARWVASRDDGEDEDDGGA